MLRQGRIGLFSYAIISYVCAGLLISYALIVNPTLFGAIRFISFEKISILTLGNAALATLALIIQLILRLTLGRLRELEIEQLIEHGKSTILDTILFLILAAPTVNGGDVPHVALITCLSGIICCKLFHSLAQIRVSHLSEAGLVESSKLGKLAILLSMLVFVDGAVVGVCYLRATFASSFYLWILFEALGLLVTSVTGLSKIAVLFVDMNLEASSDVSEGWTLKNEYMFCLDLFQDIGTLAIYLIFLLLFVFANPTRLPIYLASDIIQVTRTLVGKITSFRRYRKLAARLELDFPEPDLEELEEADTCIICRDMLTIGSKKLICGHILHFECLKGWFVHHQSCPTCRTEVPTNTSTNIKSDVTAGGALPPSVDESGTPRPFEYVSECIVGNATTLTGTDHSARVQSASQNSTSSSPMESQYSDARASGLTHSATCFTQEGVWQTFFLGPENGSLSLRGSDAVKTKKDQEISRLLQLMEQIDKEQSRLTLSLQQYREQH